jgi:hypothetical protein
MNAEKVIYTVHHLAPTLALGRSRRVLRLRRRLLAGFIMISRRDA